MSSVLLSPTPTILRITNLTEGAIGRFLRARERLPPVGKFESEVEAMNLMNLVVRNLEAITELAKIDLVLVPAANVLARAVFEIAVKAAWMVTPSDPFEREIRWLAHLEEEERMLGRIAKKVIQFGGNPVGSQAEYESLHVFRTRLAGALSSRGYTPLPGNPSVEKMLEEIGQKQIYAVYVLLAAYVHGNHHATALYRKNLGTLKEHGEFVDSASWYPALWSSWKSLYVLGSYVFDRIILGSYVLDHHTTDSLDLTEDDRQIEAELRRLSGEKVPGH